MLNGAWPSVLWNLYDYYFKPGGSYFGAKKANEPLHIAYDYFTRGVYVVNSTLTARDKLSASATLYNIPDLARKYAVQVHLSAPANAAAKALTIPPVAGLSKTYFIRLQLTDTGGAVVSNNLYWYSTSPDTLESKSDWYITPVRSYADLTGLNSLASNRKLSAQASVTARGRRQAVEITLRNASATEVAFFVRPEVTAGNEGPEVVPVSYTDNYVSLWPGESATITATYDTSDLGGRSPYLRLRGYNVPTSSIAIP